MATATEYVFKLGTTLSPDSVGILTGNAAYQSNLAYTQHITGQRFLKMLPDLLQGARYSRLLHRRHHHLLPMMNVL